MVKQIHPLISKSRQNRVHVFNYKLQPNSRCLNWLNGHAQTSCRGSFQSRHTIYHSTPGYIHCSRSGIAWRGGTACIDWRSWENCLQSINTVTPLYDYICCYAATYKIGVQVVVNVNAVEMHFALTKHHHQQQHIMLNVRCTSHHMAYGAVVRPSVCRPIVMSLYFFVFTMSSSWLFGASDTPDNRR